MSPTSSASIPASAIAVRGSLVAIKRHDRGEDQRRHRRVGPEHEHARRAEDRVADEAPDRRVQAGHRGQAGELGVGHPLGDEDRREHNPRNHIRAQPRPPVCAQSPHAGHPALECCSGAHHRHDAPTRRRIASAGLHDERRAGQPTNRRGSVPTGRVGHFVPPFLQSSPPDHGSRRLTRGASASPSRRNPRVRPRFAIETRMRAHAATRTPGGSTLHGEFWSGSGSASSADRSRHAWTMRLLGNLASSFRCAGRGLWLAAQARNLRIMVGVFMLTAGLAGAIGVIVFWPYERDREGYGRSERDASRIMCGSGSGSHRRKCGSVVQSMTWLGIR